MELHFIMGGALRKVFIKGRKVSLITAELGFTPYTIDLDNLDSKTNQKEMDKMKLTEEDKTTIYELAKLNSEKEIAKDIIKDFQKTGWRMVRRRE